MALNKLPPPPEKKIINKKHKSQPLPIEQHKWNALHPMLYSKELIGNLFEVTFNLDLILDMFVLYNVTTNYKSVDQREMFG